MAGQAREMPLEVSWEENVFVCMFFNIIVGIGLSRNASTFVLSMSSILVAVKTSCAESRRMRRRRGWLGRKA